MHHHLLNTADVTPRAPAQGVTLPAEGVVRLRTVTAVFGVSGSTIWRWIRQDKFPKPIRLGPNSVAWRVSELRDHLAKLSAS